MLSSRIVSMRAKRMSAAGRKQSFFNELKGLPRRFAPRNNIMFLGFQIIQKKAIFGVQLCSL